MNKKKYHKNNIKYIILLICCFVFIFCVIYNYSTKDKTFNRIKQEKNQNIVYPVYSKGKTNVPKINVRGDVIDKLNSVIVDKANEFLKGKNTITYNFDINGKILSLAIEYVDYYEDKYHPVITYDVYNVNIYEPSILDDTEILGLFNVTEDQIEPVVAGKFAEFYNMLVEKNFYHNECDFNCFLSLRGIEDENYMDGVHYYIKSGNLYVLKPFKIYSSFDDDKFFKTSDFLIQVTE